MVKKLVDAAKGELNSVLLIIIPLLLLGLAISGIVIFSGGFDINNKSQNGNENKSKNDTIAQTINIPLTKTNTRKPTVTPSPTLIPTETPTLTPSPSSTPTKPATTAPSPIDNDRYDEFMGTLTAEAEVDAEIPIRLRGWTVVEGEILIIAMNLTSESGDDLQRAREVNTLVSSGFAQAVYHHDNGRIGGKIPKELRIFEVNNTGAPPKTLYVNTSLARDYYLNKLSAPEFTNKYWNSERKMTKVEEKYVRELNKSAGNVTLYNESAK